MQSQQIINISFYTNFERNSLDNFVHLVFFIYNRHFLPNRRADLTMSALLQRIRGEIPPTRPNPLHTLCLASTATSTRE